MQIGPRGLRHAIHRATKEAGWKRPGICLIHIPKTGGTSVAAGIRPHFRFRHFNVNAAATTRTTELLHETTKEDPWFWEKRQAIRASIALYAAMKGNRLVTGHFAYDQGFDWLPEFGVRRATVLRDPIQRWFSAYFYNRYKIPTHGRTNLDFDDFLRSTTAKEFGSTYVRFLGGPRSDRDYSSKEAIENAKSNLESFEIIGFLDDLRSLKKSIKEQTELRVRFPHRRRSPAPPELEKKIKESQEYRTAVEKLCTPDLEIFHHAQDHFRC